MPLSTIILAAVTAERLGELVLAERNTRRLRRAGATEAGAGHYKLIVGLHVLWLGGLWVLAPDRPVNGLFLLIYILLQALRAWVMITLGSRWTTRVIAVPGEKLIERGPYRLLRHPNYAVVIGEIATLPLVFGLVGYAVLFSILNAAILWRRMHVEDRALTAAGRRPH